MPKLQDIEKLKEIVDALGNEKAIRGERGEKVEETPPPEQGLSADLENLLGIAEGESPAAGPAETGAVIADALEHLGDEDSQIDDISRILEETGETTPASEETMGLDVLPETFAEETGAPAAADAPDAALADFELPDFSGAAGVETEPAPPAAEPETEAAFEPEEPAATVEPVEPAAGEEPTFDLSDFQIPESSSAAPETGPEAMFELPEESPAPEPETDLSAGFNEPAGELSADDLGHFEMPDFSNLGGQTEGSEGAEEPAPAAGETGGLENQLFDLSDNADVVVPDAEAGAAPAEPEAEESAFASFEMPDLSAIEGGAGDEGSAGGAPAGGEEPDDSGLDQLSTDEFALPDFGAESASAAEPLREIREPAAAPEALGAPEELAGAEDEKQYSQRDFENIKATLAILPLNLKVTIEELIGSGGLRGAKLNRLIEALIAGEAPKSIAAIVSSITGKRVVLPRSFEKRSGIAFEREKDSFAYFLKTKGLKAAAIFAGGLVALIVLAYGAYQYVIRPLAAIPIYDEGYAAIKDDLYEKAKQKFDEASGIWDSKDQYYRFAEGFIQSAAGNYTYADQMYQRLLRRYPGDVKGTIDYARLLTLEQRYDRSEKLLADGLLLHDLYNFNALVAAADNYLAWAEENPARLKDADYYYTTLAEHYRDRTAAHLKKLEYLIRSERIARQAGNAGFDNTNQVVAYAAYLKRKGWDVVDPIIYTDAAEYLIDKDETDYVPDLLGRAKAADPGYAPAWYETGRFYRLSGETDKEQASLEKAVALFQQPLPSVNKTFLLTTEQKNSLERTARLVLATNRLGEIYLDRNEAERAEGLLLDAARLYEQSAAKLKTTRFAAGGQFGRIYYNLGNIAMGAGNNDRALELFAAAEENGFSDPDQTYKKGFVRYRQADYDQALVEFHRADAALPDNPNVLFALATTEYRRRQYQIAEGYYLFLIDALEKKRAALPRIDVRSNPGQRDLITDLYISYNNLGCAYFKRSVVPSDKPALAAADSLRRASELYDIMARDPDSLKRLEDTTAAGRVGKQILAHARGLLSRYLDEAAPFYNLDVLFHGRADSTELGVKIDVVAYDLVQRNLTSPKLMGTETREPAGP